MATKVLDVMRRKLRSDAFADRLSFIGHFDSWAAAEAASTGYSANEILSRTRQAIESVLRAEARYERDSCVFNDFSLPLSVLAALLRSALINDKILHVVDFGGALGSTYFHCRRFLPETIQLRWSVVEQSAHVNCGREQFENKELRFFETVEEALCSTDANVLLMSSVVQYLPRPYEFLGDAIRKRIRTVVVDRTAFLRGGGDRLTVQNVPPSIYPASYPAWFLDEQKFLAVFAADYELLATFPALDTTHPEGGEADYKGFIFELKGL